MSTLKQMIANIANAQHSTGPTSEEGKAASSKNALKHGLTASTVLLPGEDEAAYRKLCDDLTEFWGPGCVDEEQLVQNLCDTQWRLNRCPRLEAGALSKDVADFKALDIISKHEARLKKLQSTILKELEEKSIQRLNIRRAQLEQAMAVRRADILSGGRTSNFQEIGFDFSLEQVDAAIRREDTLGIAKMVASQPIQRQ